MIRVMVLMMMLFCCKPAFARVKAYVCQYSILNPLIVLFFWGKYHGNWLVLYSAVLEFVYCMGSMPSETVLLAFATRPILLSHTPMCCPKWMST